MFGERSSEDLILINALNEMTGSLFLTLLFIVMGLMMLSTILRLPLEFSAVLVTPFLLVVTAYESSFLTVLGVFLIYLAVILANNMWFTRPQ